MDIEFEMKVSDKNGKPLGTIDNIINDTWTGEPRKYMVRLEDETEAIFFTPEQVGSVDKTGVKLNLSIEELEQTD